jgi:hypothetical protein
MGLSSGVPTPDSDVRMFKALRVYCRASAAIVVGLGAVVLCGGGFHIESLMSIRPGLVTTKANTALGLALAGLSL